MAFLFCKRNQTYASPDINHPEIVNKGVLSEMLCANFHLQQAEKSLLKIKCNFQTGSKNIFTFGRINNSIL